MEFNISEKNGFRNNNKQSFLYLSTCTLLLFPNFIIIKIGIPGNLCINSKYEYGDMVATNIASYISSYEYTICFAFHFTFVSAYIKGNNNVQQIIEL